MNTFNRIAATAVASTALLMSTGVAAHAQSVTVKDKSSDVVVISSDDANADGTVLGYQDSLDSGADVRSLKVKHTKKSISITVKLAQLDPEAVLSVGFKVPGKSEPQWTLARTGRTKAEVYDVKEKKACNAPLTVKDGAKGSFKATIKRSCLKDPKKIKVAAAVSTVELGDNSISFKHDAVSASSVRTPTYTKWLKAS